MQKPTLLVLRQLKKTKGRMVAIALIIASGAAIQVGMGNGVSTVIYTRDTVTERDKLGDYQVNFWAVAEDEVPDLSKLPEITDVQRRLIMNGTINVPDSANHVQARSTSFLSPARGARTASRSSKADPSRATRISSPWSSTRPWPRIMATRSATRST